MLWVFGLGSMVIVLLAVSLLSLGFTFKGKVVIGLTSFLLALAGIAASSSISLPLTALFLLGLVLLLSYIFDKRLGTLLYLKEESSDLVIVGDIGSINVNREYYVNDEHEEMILPAGLQRPLHPVEATSIHTPQSMDESVLIDLTEEEDLLPAYEEQAETSEKPNFPDEADTGYLSDLESLIELESGKS